MHWLKTIPLSRKLLYAFGVICCFCVLQGAYTFVTFRDIGHFNEGVMRGTNFERPKHGAVSYLTRDELKAVAAHWHVPVKLD